MYGENLKNARKKKKLTQEQVAEKILTSRSNISKYETELLEPNLETLKKLCELYEVSADTILNINTTKNDKQILNIDTYINQSGTTKPIGIINNKEK